MKFCGWNWVIPIGIRQKPFPNRFWSFSSWSFELLLSIKVNIVWAVIHWTTFCPKLHIMWHPKCEPDQSSFASSPAASLNFDRVRIWPELWGNFCSCWMLKFLCTCLRAEINTRHWCFSTSLLHHLTFSLSAFRWSDPSFSKSRCWNSWRSCRRRRGSYSTLRWWTEGWREGGRTLQDSHLSPLKNPRESFLHHTHKKQI